MKPYPDAPDGLLVERDGGILRIRVAVGLAKLLIHRSLSSELNAHLADEALALELASRSDDFKEGRRARVEKRRPDFGGR